MKRTLSRSNNSRIPSRRISCSTKEDIFRQSTERVNISAFYKGLQQALDALDSMSDESYQKVDGDGIYDDIMTILREGENAGLIR